MSTILEALKGERSGHVRTQPPRRETAVPSGRRRRIGYGPGVLLAVAGTLALVFVVTLWSDRDTDSVGPAVQEPSVTTSATAEKPRRLSGMKKQPKVADRSTRVGSREKRPPVAAEESQRPRVARAKNTATVGSDPLMPPVLGSSANPALSAPVLPEPAEEKVGSVGPDSAVEAVVPSADPGAATDAALAQPPAPQPSVKQPAPEVLDEPPPGAPTIYLIFVQWVRDASARMASIRGTGGVMIVIREGDTVEGMRVASIGREWVDFSWKGTTFRVPIRRF